MAGKLPENHSQQSMEMMMMMMIMMMMMMFGGLNPRSDQAIFGGGDLTSRRLFPPRPELDENHLRIWQNRGRQHLRRKVHPPGTGIGLPPVIHFIFGCPIPSSYWGTIDGHPRAATSPAIGAAYT